VEFRLDNDPGSNLVGQRTVGTGDSTDDLMPQDKGVDHIGAISFPDLDVSA
jgi:hypothetical protein